MKKPEQALHEAVAQYLDFALPNDAVWSTVSHGGFRLPIQTAVTLKRAGLKAGVPDIMILHDGSAYFIELKAKGNYPTPVQRRFHERINQAGGYVEVCRSITDVTNFLKRMSIL